MARDEGKEGGRPPFLRLSLRTLLRNFVLHRLLLRLKCPPLLRLLRPDERRVRDIKQEHAIHTRVYGIINYNRNIKIYEHLHLPDQRPRRQVPHRVRVLSRRVRRHVQELHPPFRRDELGVQPWTRRIGIWSGWRCKKVILGVILIHTYIHSKRYVECICNESFVNETTSYYILVFTM